MPFTGNSTLLAPGQSFTDLGADDELQLRARLAGALPVATGGLPPTVPGVANKPAPLTKLYSSNVAPPVSAPIAQPQVNAPPVTTGGTPPGAGGTQAAPVRPSYPTEAQLNAMKPHGWREALGLLASTAAGIHDPRLAYQSAENLIHGKGNEAIENAKRGQEAFDVKTAQGQRERQLGLEEARLNEGKYQPDIIKGPNGEPMAVHYDPKTGQHLDASGAPIPNAVKWTPPPRLGQPVATEKGVLIEDKPGHWTLHPEYGAKAQAGTTNDFEQFYGDWLKDNNAPDNSHNRKMARKEWSEASQAPERPPQGLAVVPTPEGDQRVVLVRPGETLAKGAAKFGAKEPGPIPPELKKPMEAYENAAENHRLMNDFLQDVKKAGKMSGPESISLLARHMGINFPPGAGMRQSIQMIQAHAQARSYAQGIQAWLQKLDPEAGGVITPDQAERFVHMADQNQREKYTTLQREGKTYHADLSDVVAPGGETGGHGGGAPGKTIRARDENGKLHEAPEGTALPKGWALEKK